MEEKEKNKFEEFQIGGLKVNVAAALPLTIGDWRKLKPMGITPDTLSTFDADFYATFAQFLLSKAAGSQIAMEVVDSISIDVLTDLLLYVAKTQRAPVKVEDRPT